MLVGQTDPVFSGLDTSAALAFQVEVPPVGTILEIPDPWAGSEERMPVIIPEENGPFVSLTGDEAVHIYIGNGNGMVMGVTPDCSRLLLGFERFIQYTFNGTPTHWCRAVVLSPDSIHPNYLEAFAIARKKMILRICKVVGIDPSNYHQYIKTLHENMG